MMSAANLTVSGSDAEIDLTDAIAEFKGNAIICVDDAPIYIMETETDGSLTGNIFKGELSLENLSSGKITLTGVTRSDGKTPKNSSVMVDYYVDLPGQHVWEADITPETFGGNYYVEADTLFRDQNTGKDLPANLTFPNVKIQANFTMTFAGTGDPSTFDFTMDAMPGYTYFDKSKKVLAVMQIIDTAIYGNTGGFADKPVMPHNDVLEHDDPLVGDSNVGFPDVPATSMELSSGDDSFSLPVGGKKQIVITVAPENATVTATSSSENYTVLFDGSDGDKKRFTITRVDGEDGATITYTSGELSKTTTISAI